MKQFAYFMGIGLLLTCNLSCSQQSRNNERNQEIKKAEVTAKDILGNPNYPAISYGGYREKSREIQPTLAQLKEDLKILSAMGIRILRTYNVHYPHAANVVKAIHELKEIDPDFEMYVMLGAWIDCKNAWTDQAPDHTKESEKNAQEIATAVALANQYPDIIKIIAVGNEAMVKWAERYYVEPAIILKWVNHLQSLKKKGGLASTLWITSSDDFASWGGGDPQYHTPELELLMKAVDYISIHTYPYHNTHYNPQFWHVPPTERKLSEIDKIDAAMVRANKFAQNQYQIVNAYVKSLGIDKPVHIGESGWATISDGFYGAHGSNATDEYKQGQYYTQMRAWTKAKGIACFYFEAFDEPWKDAGNPSGSENHFGLFTLTGKAKYPLWELVDQGVFKGLTRNGNPITKTYNGDIKKLLQSVGTPPAQQ